MTEKPAREFPVELPAGGLLHLQDEEEVEAFEKGKKLYQEDYALVKPNDLVQLGAILIFQIAMYRAQRDLTSEDSKVADKALSKVIEASDQIAKIEKGLGIDKKSRESGGAHTVSGYVTTVKRAARMKAIRIVERVKWVERFIMEASWRVRLLQNGDAEDRAHHGISKDSFIEWIASQIDEFHEKEKEWAKDKGRVFVGKL